MASLDIIQTTRGFCLKDTTFKTAIFSRIYCPDVPQVSPSFPAVSFRVFSGSTHVELPISMPVIEFRCYVSEQQSHANARQIYNLLHTAIHGKNNIVVTGAGRVLWCKNVMEGQDLIDPQLRWKYVRSLFEIGMTIES